MKKSTKFILYFWLTLFLLNSCTTEKEFVEKNNSTKQYSIKEYTAKEADNLVKFQAIKQRIVKNLMNMSNNESSREVLGFTVDDSMMKEISTTNYSSYNMLILRDVPITDYFENLVIEQKSDTINAYVVKYTPSSTSNLFDGGFDGTIEASKVYGQTCIVCPGSGESGSDGDGGGFSGLGGGGTPTDGVICTTVFKCNIFDPAHPNLPMPHISYSTGCEQIPFVTCTGTASSSSLTSSGASTGSNTGPGNGGLHGGSGSNSGATNENNPIVIPVPPPVHDPCKTFTNLQSDNIFKGVVQFLKTQTVLTNEVGYSLKPILNVDNTPGYNATPGVPDPNTNYSLGFNPEDITNATIVIHTHNVGGLSIFSADDLRQLYVLLTNPNITLPINFMLVVVTPNEDVYSMTISDKDAFISFGEKWFSNINAIKGFESLFYDDNFFNINGNNTDEINEVNFLKLIGKTNGISLQKANSELTQWDSLSLSTTNTVVPSSPCN